MFAVWSKENGGGETDLTSVHVPCWPKQNYWALTMLKIHIQCYAINAWTFEAVGSGCSEHLAGAGMCCITGWWNKLYRASSPCINCKCYSGGSFTVPETAWVQLVCTGVDIQGVWTVFLKVGLCVTEVSSCWRLYCSNGFWQFCFP